MFDIVGMGNAIVDLTTKAAENPAFKNMHISQRGGFFRTRMDEFEEILHFSKNNEISAGGSVANSMKAFAALGGKASSPPHLLGADTVKIKLDQCYFITKV